MLFYPIFDTFLTSGSVSLARVASLFHCGRSLYICLSFSMFTRNGMVIYALHRKKIVERVFVGEVQSHWRECLKASGDNWGYPSTVPLI